MATTVRPSDTREPAAADLSFRDQPLAYLDRRLPTAGDAFWLPGDVLCVAESSAAKAVLANPDGRMREHSDFFHTSRGSFGPREVQVALGRGGRRLLTAHTAARAAALPALVEERLAGESDWPDAGIHLIAAHLRAALVAPAHEAEVGALVDRIIERGVLPGARERHGRISRAIFRWRAFRALRREVERRVDAGAGGERDETGRDLFDVLAAVAGPGVRTADLGELYLPFLFAVASSVGLTLGWSLWLLGDGEAAAEAEPAWIVREALRLWPIAWQLARFPAEPHAIAGVEVTPGHVVLVCPYVTHRHPAYWDEPGRFQPDRWARPGAHDAWLPFGWGPHTCAAASLTLELVAEVLAVLRRDFRFTVTRLSDQPFTGPSLAPPRFRLDLRPRTR